MAKGENIFKRKDGRWEARYIKGYELSGKIKYGFCYGKTYKEAKEKVTKCKAALVTGQPIPQSSPKHRFAYYCDEWLDNAKGKIKESTAVKYASMLEKHIKPKLGGCFPLGLSTGVVDSFRDELLFEDELSPKTSTCAKRISCNRRIKSDFGDKLICFSCGFRYTDNKQTPGQDKSAGGHCGKG